MVKRIWRRISLRALLGAVAVIALPVVSVTSLFAIRALDGVEGASDEMLDRRTEASRVRDINISLTMQRGLQAEYAVLRDPAILATFEETAEVSFGALRDLAARYPDDPDVIAVVERVEALDLVHDAIVFDEMVPAFDAGDEVTGGVALGRAQETLTQLLAEVSTLVGVFEAQAAEADAEVAARADETRSLVIVILLGTAGAGFLSLWLALRALTTRLRASVDLLEHTRGELQQIDGTVLDQMADTNQEVAAIAESSQHVMGEMQVLAGSVQDLGAAIAEISASSSSASSVAATAVTRADQTNATVATLGQSSAQIGQVIEVITSIAKQTSAATDQISSLISEIQRDSEDSVHAIEEIRGIIGEISDIQTIVAAAVEEQAAVTGQMSMTVQTVNNGIEQLANRAVVLKESSDRTAAGVANSSERRRQLDSVRDDLRQLISLPPGG